MYQIRNPAVHRLFKRGSSVSGSGAYILMQTFSTLFQFLLEQKTMKFVLFICKVPLLDLNQQQQHRLKRRGPKTDPWGTPHFIHKYTHCSLSYTKGHFLFLLKTKRNRVFGCACCELQSIPVHCGTAETCSLFRGENIY